MRSLIKWSIRGFVIYFTFQVGRAWGWDDYVAERKAREKLAVKPWSLMDPIDELEMWGVNEREAVNEGWKVDWQTLERRAGDNVLVVLAYRGGRFAPTHEYWCVVVDQEGWGTWLDEQQTKSEPRELAQRQLIQAAIAWDENRITKTSTSTIRQADELSAAVAAYKEAFS